MHNDDNSASETEKLVQRIDDLEDVVIAYGDFEDEVVALVDDRQRLLDALGITEHEWACRGGRRFPPFRRPSDEIRINRAAILSAHEGSDRDEAEVLVDTVPPMPPPPPPPLPPVVEMPPPPWLAGPPPPPPPPPVHAQTSDMPEWLDAIAPPTPPMPKIEWTPEQREALDAIDRWHFYQGGFDDAFVTLTGPAGTGKSTLVRELIERYPTAVLTAMTGKAAMRLSQCAMRDASTLHSVLYYPPKPGEDMRFTRLREPPSSLIVVDEASMMTPAVFNHCKVWAQHEVRFLLVGDAFQLPPVITEKEERELYGDDYSVFAEVNGPALTQVMRNAGGVLEAATHVRTTGEICTRSIPDGLGGYEYARELTPVDRAVSDYLADRDDHLLITWRNEIRMKANAMVRERLGHGGPLPDEGEPVLVKKNGQGFLNGEIATCGGFEMGPTLGSMRTLWMVLNGIRVLVSFEGREEMFDGIFPRIENWKGFHIDLKKGGYSDPIPVTWGYCVTAHSAQGSEARRVTVFLERGDDRSSHFRKPTRLPDGSTTSFASRWIYTATTRSKHRTTMVVGR